jgi:HK97 family phage prohead protease
MNQVKKPFFFQVAVKDFKASPSGDDGKAEVVKISGLASTPGIDRYGDIVEPEAFAKALDRFMKNPVLLRSHDSDRPCGLVTKATISGDGLAVEADVMDGQTGAEIKDGRMRALSIGYIPLFTVLKWKDEDGTIRDFNAESDSYWSPNCIRVIKELDLVEISVVSTPANAEALFTLAKSLKSIRETVSVKDMNAMLAGEASQNTTTEPAEAKADGASTEQTADAAAADAGGQDAAAAETDAAAGSTGADAAAGDAGTGDAADSADTEAKDTDVADTSAADAGAETDAAADTETDAGTDTDAGDEGAGIAPKPEDEEAAKAAETAAAGATAPDASAAGEGKDAGQVTSEGKLVAFPSDAVEASKAVEPLLKELGIIAEGAEEGASATKLPDQVKDLFVGMLQHIVQLTADIETAEGKLAKIPQKRALAPAAQAGADGTAKAAPGDFLRILGIPLPKSDVAK